MAERKNPGLVPEFERALESVLARVFAFGDSSRKLAIAFSGGVDSTALLYLAHAYAKNAGMTVLAFHVHHGLNVCADSWLSHCQAVCEELDILFDSRRVSLRPDDPEGVEAAARRERYAALSEMCHLHGVNFLLTAHHENDQAETVLMQLLRGAGVAGLSGMDMLGAVPGAGDRGGVYLLRPLLGISRQDLEDWVADQGLVYVDDDSNANPRYVRNAIRLKVSPALSRFFPGYEKRIARSAMHAQSAQRLLDELARMDWQSSEVEGVLDVRLMARLGEDRFDNLLRFWLHAHGLRMPSTAWMNEARVQLLSASDDAQIRLETGGAIIRRYKNGLYCHETEKDNTAHSLTDAFSSMFFWKGEEAVRLDDFRGTLFFRPAYYGVDREWLLGQRLSVCSYRGMAVLKVAKNRPRRNLKRHYQESGIPAWERLHMPLVYVEDNLLFAGGIGLSADFVKTGENQVEMEWVADK